MAHSPLFLARLPEIVRYYQAGIVNALFGFGLYALFVRAGVNIYMAQILSTVLGATFNYFTYSWHVFGDAAPAKARFVVSYGVNYLVSLLILYLMSHAVNSPYIAGILTIAATSVINYFMLKYGVFTRKRKS